MAATAILIGLMVLVGSPARAEQGSLAQRCPTYAQHLQNASARLAVSDRDAALTELKRAREAVSECVRLEAEIQGLPTMLASAHDAKGKA